VGKSRIPFSKSNQEKHMVKNSNSIRWSCTVGINEGYDLTSQKSMPLDDFVKIYMDIAIEIFEETGTYISAVVTPSRTIYNSDWGCPQEGEFSYTISGFCNPEFSTEEEFRMALNAMICKLKERLNQCTALLEILPTELIYYS